MKMNKVLFLALVTVGSLSACGTKTTSSIAPATSSEQPVTTIVPSSSSTSSSSEQKPSIPDNTDIVIPNKDGNDIDVKEEGAYSDKLFLNRRVVGVSVNGTDKIRGIERALCKGDQLNFVSADTSIATVAEDGTVTGVKSGQTTIEVSDKNHPDVKKTVEVYVYPEVKSYIANTYLNALGAINEDDLKAVCDHEIYERTVYKVDDKGNRQLHMYGAWDQNIVVSLDDAYLRLYETDGNRKTDDGNMTFLDYEWIFYTNKFYDTYGFHTRGNAKGYYPVSTVSYMGQPRTAPLFDILDNIFVSGRSIFTNTLNGAKLSDRFLSIARASYMNQTFKGSWGSGSFYLEANHTDEDNTADQDTENNYGIPVGTAMPETDYYRFIVKDNKLVGYSIQAETNYEIDGQKYAMTYDIDHYFERVDESNKSKLVVYPNVKDYTLADYLFAI